MAAQSNFRHFVDDSACGEVGAGATADRSPKGSWTHRHLQVSYPPYLDLSYVVTRHRHRL